MLSGIHRFRQGFKRYLKHAMSEGMLHGYRVNGWQGCGGMIGAQAAAALDDQCLAVEIKVQVLLTYPREACDQTNLVADPVHLGYRFIGPVGRR